MFAGHLYGRRKSVGADLQLGIWILFRLSFRADVTEEPGGQKLLLSTLNWERVVAKLYFYYSTMNAGKSTTLLQSSYNYHERGMNTLLLTPMFDDRFGVGTIASRIGIDASALPFGQSDNLFEITRRLHHESTIHCVLVDEAQFLTKQQVHQLTEVVDVEGIPVLAYGLRTDFQGNLFEGSEYLMAWSDSLSEIKTICHCGRKATMVLRLDDKGRPMRDGEQIKIGGNDRYLSVCRRHFKAGITSRHTNELPFESSE